MATPRTTDADVIVVGGGLAGLTAAATAARTGARVTLFEARSDPGGRARSERVDGFALNQGAHALYRANPGIGILKGLGVRPRGGIPLQKGGGWLRDGERIPFRHLSAVGGRQAATAARALLSKKAAADAEGQSIGEWLDTHIPDAARPLADFLVRITSYSADQAHTEASALLAQVRSGARGVLYLDGGWSSLVDGLLVAAGAAGVKVRRDKVTGVVASDDGVVVTTAADGFTARSVVLAAGGAAHADALLGGASDRVSGWAASARPVLAACLDVALSRVPVKHRQTSFALDEPLYLVDHASTAAIAPKGGAVFQGLYYEPDLHPDVDPRGRLEAALDLVQPGWRDVAVAVRPSRSLVVAHDRPQPGVDRRELPVVTLDDLPGVHVAGDWITSHGLLADAALASGAEAGTRAAAAAMAASVLVDAAPATARSTEAPAGAGAAAGPVVA